MPIFLLAGSAWIAAVHAADEPARFVAHTTEAVLPAAALVRLDPDWSLQLEAPAGAIAAASLVELRQPGRTRPPWPVPPFVLLTHGDCLPLTPGTPVTLADGRLNVTTLHAAKELSVYAPYLALCFVALPETIDEPVRFLARLRREARPRDVVYLRNGDRIEGTVTRLDAEGGCEVLDDERKLHVAAERLAGVAWNTVRLARPRLRGVLGHAVLDDGTRINLTHLRSAPAGRLAGKTWFGAEITFAADRLVALDIWQGAAVYLSELAGRYEHTPYLGVSWPLRLDTAVDDMPLTLGGSVFDRGLGVHTQSRMRYDLGGKYRCFEAIVGLDPRAKPRGRARLAVEIDGRRHDVGGKEEWSVRDGPVPVRIDVRGAHTMMLVADFGSLGDVQGMVNWCNARLVK